MREEDLFCRRPMGMRMAMIVRQWRAVIDDAILETGLTQSSWTVMMQLKQLGDNVSVSELAEVQGIELPPLMRTLSQLEKQGYLLRTISRFSAPHLIKSPAICGQSAKKITRSNNHDP